MSFTGKTNVLTNSPWQSDTFSKQESNSNSGLVIDQSYILLEDGSYLLLEDGSRIVTEESV